MYTVKLLTTLVENHQILAYTVIFLGLIFEGEVVVITTGVLAYLGALDFTLSLVFIFTGSFVKTFVLYYLGEILNKKFSYNKFFQYIERRVLYFMPRFEQKPFWSIFLSKFIMGTNYLVILFSGYKKISLETFLKAEIISTIIWAPALLSLGFFFSQTAISISKEISKFSLVIFGLVIVFLLFDKIVSSLYTFFEYFKNGVNGNGDKK
ncbi:MAG: VTT domain-containing protein [Patescibacteria group bacterium]